MAEIKQYTKSEKADYDREHRRKGEYHRKQAHSLHYSYFGRVRAEILREQRHLGHPSGSRREQAHCQVESGHLVHKETDGKDEHEYADEHDQERYDQLPRLHDVLPVQLCAEICTGQALHDDPQVGREIDFSFKYAKDRTDYHGAYHRARRDV